MIFYQDSRYQTDYYISKQLYLECIWHIYIHTITFSVNFHCIKTYVLRFFFHWLSLLIFRIMREYYILNMFVPCPFDLHIGCHFLYDPISKIGSGTWILGIQIRVFSPVISYAHVGHRYCDTYIYKLLPCGTN